MKRGKIKGGKRYILPKKGMYFTLQIANRCLKNL